MSATPQWSPANWFANLEWGRRLGQSLADMLGCSCNDPDSVYNIVKDEKMVREAIASRAFQDAVFQVIAAGSSSLRRDPDPNRTRERGLEGKFTSTSLFELTYGDEESFLGSLDAYLGRPKDMNFLVRMRHEHLECNNSRVRFQIGSDAAFQTTPADEWHFVVSPEFPAYAGYYDDAGQPVMRQPVNIDSLMDNNVVLEAGLRREEVVAARLYTGPMYKLYNSVLRNAEEGRYLYTIHAFASCIIKLSRVHHINTVYRGLAGCALPEKLVVPDKCGARGGTELGFLSFTSNKEIALDFAGDGAGSFMYELQEGMIDRGADLSWVSQYPTEDEIVFPPLTNLQVVGTPSLVGTTVFIQMRANVNLKIKTVEELINLSKMNLLDTLDWYYDEVRGTQYGFDPEPIDPCWLDELKKYRQELEGYEGWHFNTQHFYRQCVNQSLDLKEGTIHKIHILHTLLSKPINHPTPEFHKMIDHVRKRSCTLFASLEHRVRYICTASTTNVTDDDVGDNLSNYESVWSLPLSQGSWTTLLKGCDHAERIVVAHPQSSFFRRAVRKLGSTNVFRAIFSPIFTEQFIDALQGLEGVYLFLGTANPVWQLCAENGEGELKRKYLYYHQDRWYVGPSVGSPNAEARSVPCDMHCKPYSTPQGFWETSNLGAGLGQSDSKNFEIDETMQVTRQVSTPVERLSSDFTQNEHERMSLAEQMPFLIRSGTDQLWAFINRMEVEEAVLDLHPTEVDSIALFCNLIGYMVPKRLLPSIHAQQMKHESWQHFLPLLFIKVLLLLAILGTMGIMITSFISEGFLGVHIEATYLAFFMRGCWLTGILIFCFMAFGVYRNIIKQGTPHAVALRIFFFILIVVVSAFGAAIFFGAERMAIAWPICSFGLLVGIIAWSVFLARRG